MIVKKETELNHPIIILENQKEVDFMLRICNRDLIYIDFDSEKRNHKLAILKRLSRPETKIRMILVLKSINHNTGIGIWQKNFEQLPADAASVESTSRRTQRADAQGT